jgi:hypothetical protein
MKMEALSSASVEPFADNLRARIDHTNGFATDKTSTLGSQAALGALALLGSTVLAVTGSRWWRKSAAASQPEQRFEMQDAFASKVAAAAFAGETNAAVLKSANVEGNKLVSKRSSSRVAMKYDASGEIGVTEPMGYFDPCDFMKGADKETFDDYRAKELKHGRIAMLALFGFLVQPFAESAHIGFSGVPGGVQAMTTYPGSAGFGALFLIAGFFELRILPDLEKPGEPGNYSDPLKLVGGPLGTAYDEKWRNFELNNGRLAMFGVIGTITAGFYTGYDAYDQWKYAKPVAIDFIRTTMQNVPP